MRKRVWLVGGLSSLGLFNVVSPGWAAPLQQEQSAKAAEPLASEPSNDRSVSRCAGIPQQVQPDVLEGSCESSYDSSMSQVRSVNELSDVRPTDWAYQTLQALSERYGVAIGYPDGTFRGNQALTRNEFAAALSRVLDEISQQFAIGQGNVAQLQEDFATLKQLQASYGTIAADLRDRSDKLEQQITTLERQSFSTTTKLVGQTVLGLTNGSNAHSTVLSRTRLDLLTSFAPDSLLRTQLEVGNNGNDAIGRVHERGQNLLGTLGLLADGGGLDYVRVGNAARVSKLYYTFQPTDGLALTVGARISPRDFIDFNRFANDSTKNFSSSFFTNNPLIVQNQIDRPGGAGAVLAWKPERLPLIIRALYVAADAEQPNGGSPGGGLFGDRNQGSLEVEYDFTKNIVTRLQFTKATVNNVDIVAGGLNAEWALNQDFAVFGRFAIGSYKGFNPLLNQNLDLSPKSWSIGFLARRLIVPGSTAGLAIGQPFVERNLGNATQTNVEAFYSFLLNDSISVTPALNVVSKPNNRDRGTIFEWLLRLVYSF